MNEQTSEQTNQEAAHFVVCGLGSLGQHCVTALKKFGVSVVAIEKELPKTWEISGLPRLLDQLIIGDCREDDILEQAKIKQCSAILLVTSDEEVNAQTALTVRQLNPTIRLVLRSSRENLNQLLGEQLGNFFASSVTLLATTAFALAGLEDDTIGLFSLDGEQLKVIKRQINSDDPWCKRYLLHELNTKRRRILSHIPDPTLSKQPFHDWETSAQIKPGDTLIYIELVETISHIPVRKTSPLRWRYAQWRSFLQPFIARCQLEIKNFKQFEFLKQFRSIAAICGLTVIVLLIFGTILFSSYYPETTILHAFYATIILLLGGYGDLFGQFKADSNIPGWLQFFSLLLTVVGTVFVGILYASLTEILLAAKFDLNSSRPAIPQEGHLIVVGLARIGQGVAAFLQEVKQSLVAISLKGDVDQSILPNVPLVVGNFKDALNKVNLKSARSVILTTDSEMLNLEIALMARSINPQTRLVIGVSNDGLSSRLKGLLENVHVINTYAVAAEAFSGAAFGENILSLFRQDNTTILVTEYTIVPEDTLNGLLISEFAYGYNVVVISYQKNYENPLLMPSDDIRLQAGDRIVILATTSGLRAIEQGTIQVSSRCWSVRIIQVIFSDFMFEGANTIARISGCNLQVARDAMSNVPQTLPVSLYRHQADYLIRELQKGMVKTELINLTEQ